MSLPLDLAQPRRLALPSGLGSFDSGPFLESARAFVAAHWSPVQALRQPAAARAAWFQALVRAGRTVPDWPAQWGGAGWRDLECYLWWRTLSEAGAPRPDPVAIDWVGPALWLAGSAAQQQRWLPGVRALEVAWCMALEGLRVPRMRAASSPWSLTATLPAVLGAAAARHMLLLLVADDVPGGSLVVLDLAAPGVSREPVGTAGAAVIHLVEVAVPADAWVGPQGDGRAIVARLAARPATWLQPVADLRSVLESLQEAARALPGDADTRPAEAPKAVGVDTEIEADRDAGMDAGMDADTDAEGAQGASRLSADPLFRRRYAELALSLLALEALELRAAELPPTAELALALRSALPERRARLADLLDALIADAFGYYSTVGADPRAIDNEGPIGHHSGVAALRARLTAQRARAVPDWFGLNTPTLGY